MHYRDEIFVDAYVASAVYEKDASVDVPLVVIGVFVDEVPSVFVVRCKDDDKFLSFVFFGD